MDFKDFTAGINDNNRRIDKIIRKMIPDSNISSLYSAIRKGLIRVNNKKCSVNYKVSEGDIISVAKFLIKESSEEIESQQQDTDISISTVYSNKYVRIINKPYDVSVHGENGLSTIVENIYNSEIHSDSLSFKTGPLHRLDRKTTGLLTFSNSLAGAEWFSKAISDKKIQKFYIGICQGHLSSREIWTDYLIQDNSKSSFYRMKITQSEISEKNKAITIATPLSYGKYKNIPVTLCQFQILTGKKHQIRCQSSYHNIPLLGDTAYNGLKINESQDFFLHAYKMIFPKDNPIELPEEITAPVPMNFEKFLNVSLLNWNSRLIIN